MDAVYLGDTGLEFRVGVDQPDQFLGAYEEDAEIRVRQVLDQFRNLFRRVVAFIQDALMRLVQDQEPDTAFLTVPDDLVEDVRLLGRLFTYRK